MPGNRWINSTLGLLACCCIVSLSGCSEPSTIYIGDWEVDQAEFRRNIEGEYPGDSEDRVELRERIIEANLNATWVFDADGSFSHDGAWPAHGRYRIYDYGEDWVIVRLLIEGMEGEDPSAHYSQMNEMSPQEWIEHEGQRSGTSPLLIGFEFVSDDRMLEFSLVVRDGKITDERHENVHFNRVP